MKVIPETPVKSCDECLHEYTARDEEHYCGHREGPGLLDDSYLTTIHPDCPLADAVSDPCHQDKMTRDEIESIKTWAEREKIIYPEHNGSLVLTDYLINLCDMALRCEKAEAELREAREYINLFQPPVPGETPKEYQERLALLLRTKKENLELIEKGGQG